MKVSEKQLMVMFDALEGSLSLYDRSDSPLFRYTREAREKFYKQIINQQSDELVEVESNESAEEK